VLRRTGGPPSTSPALPALEPVLVDRERFDRLAEEIGPSALRSVLGTFLQELPDRLEAIRIARAAHDETDLRRAAHGLRSPAVLLGATELGDRCRAIEEASAPLLVADLDSMTALAGRSAAALRSAASDVDP
jgi:HPt (histidine-containing phosphotransfer) domain-containing protein